MASFRSDKMSIYECSEVLVVIIYDNTITNTLISFGGRIIGVETNIWFFPLNRIRKSKKD